MTPFLGHDKQRKIFQQSFAEEKLHHAWILAGPKGIGKAGFARQAAHFLLSANDQDTAKWPATMDNSTGKLLAARSHPDFRLLQRGGKTDKDERRAREEGIELLEEHERKRNITIDQVRALQSLFSTQSSISKYRVVAIDAIDDLERGGANALLKNLEEPPKDTIFLLVSHAPERLLPTIRSRCQILRFNPLNDELMTTVIRGISPNLENAELSALVAAGEGSPGQALQYMDAGLAELEATARQIMKNGDRDNALKTELARKLALKAALPRYRAFLARAPSLIAQHIKSSEKNSRLGAIEAWREASDLSSAAIPKALDNQAVVFRLASLMASLAQNNSQA